MLSIRSRTIVHLLTALSLAVAAAACDDSTGPDEEEEPEVATLRLSIGSQTINVDTEDGTVTGGPIVVSVGNTTISATFLKADGNVETIVTDEEFRLDVASDNGNVASFSRTGPFGGSIVGAGAGQTVLRVSLFHIVEGHDEFGPFPVAVTVQ